ncbi:MAG: TIGR02594 family protein, partial [Proteobacteria bacterium]|nr:TIGR02594 family protein [Pseudomonadota bacterium]
DLAQRFVGVKEVPDTASNPHVLAMLRLDQKWPKGDHVPWCSAFINYVAWLLRLPRSKSLMARSWLLVGKPVPKEEAEVGFDVVVLKRGGANQPGPEKIDAPGHVGLFAGREGKKVLILGGNQSDAVNVSLYPETLVLGVRRLA